MVKKEKRIPTTERLAQALEAEKDPRLKEMIERARAGYYDDYKSSLTFPLVQLVIDLRKIGGFKFWEFEKRIINGEFDATTWEAEAWANSEEGRETFKALLGDFDG